MHILILILALLIDLILGEPHRLIHPVVWMGKVIEIFECFRQREKRILELIWGMVTVVIVVFLFSVPLYYILARLAGFNTILYVLVSAWLLKTTFSIRELKRSAKEVEQALINNKIDLAKLKLKNLVSRPTNLSEIGIISATVESIAENITDSIIAPLFYFMLFGLPGAFAYRAVNTMDAMIGYRGKYEFFGKDAARLDDILNFIPARIAGVFIVITAFSVGEDYKNSFRIMRRDRGLTQSPNAGWTIGAMAGALGVSLEKPGCYKLGEAREALTPHTIRRALKIIC